jgi:hypothetical protein
MDNIFGLAGKSVIPIADEISGNDGSVSGNKQISILRAISEAFVTITQDVSQSALSSQIVSLDCSREATGNACLKCYDILKSVNASEEKMIKTCRNVCNCSIEDVEMNQLVTINTSAFFESDVSQDFITQFKNSIYMQAKKSGKSLFNDTDLDTLQSSITNIYTELKSSTFQAKIDNIQSLQVVELRGAGSIKTVDLTSIIDYVSQAVKTTGTIQTLINDLEKQMLSLSSQVTKGTMEAIIELFVSVIFMILLALIGYITFSTIFDIIALL